MKPFQTGLMLVTSLETLCIFSVKMLAAGNSDPGKEHSNEQTVPKASEILERFAEPDFEKLGTFDHGEIRDGTRVLILSSTNGGNVSRQQGRWRAGEILPD